MSVLLEPSVNGNGVHQGAAAPEEGAAAAEGAGRARNEDRDEGGRFAKGNKGGPGNPYNREVARIKRALLSVMTDEQTVALGKKLLEQALNGDVAAARVLFQYTMPKNVDPDRVDLQEWDKQKEEAEMMKDLPSILEAPSPEVPLLLARGAREAATRGMARVFGNVLAMEPEEAALWKQVADPAVAMQWLREGKLGTGQTG